MPHHWRLLICLIVIAYKYDGKCSSYDKQTFPKSGESFTTANFPTKRYKRSIADVDISLLPSPSANISTKSTTGSLTSTSSNIAVNSSTIGNDDAHSTDSPPGHRKSEVGTSLFYDLVAANNNMYVDKTLIVREFLNCPGKVVLITRPDKWGKTINMDTLKTFLTIQSSSSISVHDDDDNNNNNNNNNNNRSSTAIGRDNSNYKLFAGGEIRTEDGQLKKLPSLKIARHDDIMEEHQGRYPVIWVTFKNIEGRTYEEIENGTKKRIRNLYLDHGYMDRDGRLNEIERRILKSYMTGDFDREYLKTSLFFLCRLLKNHFDREVFVFVDDYDAPVKNAFVKTKQRTKKISKVLLDKVFKQTYKLFGAIISEVVEDNVFLKKALLSGTVRLDTMVNGLNNLTEYSLLDDDRFGEFYGFSQTEVDELINETDSRPDRSEMRRWYGSFDYGGQRSLYNPWSITRCLKSKLFKPYWTQSDRTSYLIEKSSLVNKYRQDVRKVTTGGTCTVRTDSDFNFENLDTREGVFNALLYLGYLNPTCKKGDKWAVTVPNEEVRLWYAKQVGDE